MVAYSNQTWKVEQQQLLYPASPRRKGFAGYRISSDIRMLIGGQDIVVSTATHYGLDDQGIESRWVSDLPYPSWSPSSLLYNGHRVSFPGVKRPGRGVDHPPHLAPWVRKSRAITLRPFILSLFSRIWYMQNIWLVFNLLVQMYVDKPPKRCLNMELTSTVYFVEYVYIADNIVICCDR
jgi:hypothetical protein